MGRTGPMGVTPEIEIDVCDGCGAKTFCVTVPRLIESDGDDHFCWACLEVAFYAARARA